MTTSNCTNPRHRRLLQANRELSWAMGERMKELRCVYGMAEVFERPGLSTNEILQGIVDLLPAAWQYPEVTCARMVTDGATFATAGFREGCDVQSADVTVGGARYGTLEVHYLEERPPRDEGPFLNEERSLVNEVARRVGRIIERRRTEEERRVLEEQLLHADRLATLGQLAAGVAHELNEPLNGIVGFAQLAKKTPGVPAAAERDMERIVNAALHAREVVRKLLLFSRQTPPQKTRVGLDGLIHEALALVGPRMAREGIELVCELAPDLPRITADPSQIQQVVINLAVNAIQAMPQGGRLRLHTRAEAGFVVLTVEDTGVGMTDDVLRRIYTPFFTTKDVGQGTGLGLPVIHGIVTAHGGTIAVRSRVGEGTTFEIRLPA